MNPTEVPLTECTVPIRRVDPARGSLGDYFDYIDLSSVDQAHKQITAPSRIQAAKAPSRARQVLASGDVLVSTVRPNLNAVALVKPEHDGAIGSTGFSVLRPAKNVDGGYLFHWVQSPAFVQRLVGQATGASYPAVSDRIVKSSTLPLPSLAEQRWIARVLDAADALRAARKAARERTADLGTATFVEAFGERQMNSRGLPVVRLQELCSRITDGTHQPPQWASSGHPFLFVRNIVGGEINYATEKFISSATHLQLTARCPIEQEDVLYSTVGSYGVPAIVRTSEKFAFQRHIAHLKPDHALVHPEYLRAALASPDVRRQADRIARGVAQKTLNLDEIRRFWVLLPPLAAQERFATVVAAINQSRAKAEAHLDHLDILFASLQSRAFAGER